MLVAMKSVKTSAQLPAILSVDFSIAKKNILTPAVNPTAQILTDEFAPIEKYMALMLL
jgi:hypothetical protein